MLNVAGSISTNTGLAPNRQAANRELRLYFGRAAENVPELVRTLTVGQSLPEHNPSGRSCKFCPDVRDR